MTTYDMLLLEQDDLGEIYLNLLENSFFTDSALVAGGGGETYPGLWLTTDFSVWAIGGGKATGSGSAFLFQNVDTTVGADYEVVVRVPELSPSGSLTILAQNTFEGSVFYANTLTTAGLYRRTFTASDSRTRLYLKVDAANSVVDACLLYAR